MKKKKEIAKLILNKKLSKVLRKKFFKMKNKNCLLNKIMKI